MQPVASLSNRTGWIEALGRSYKASGPAIKVEYTLDRNTPLDRLKGSQMASTRRCRMHLAPVNGIMEALES